MNRFYLFALTCCLMFCGVWSAQAQEILDPRFPGCADKGDLDCAEMKMLQFIFSNLHMPDAAKAAGIKGVVKAKFTINTKGEVKNGTILEGLGHGCDDEVLRIIGMMPPWLPGEEDGVAKDMDYEISVKFQ